MKKNINRCANKIFYLALLILIVFVSVLLIFHLYSISQYSICKKYEKCYDNLYNIANYLESLENPILYIGEDHLNIEDNTISSYYTNELLNKNNDLQIVMELGFTEIFKENGNVFFIYKDDYLRRKGIVNLRSEIPKEEQKYYTVIRFLDNEWYYFEKY